MALRSGCAQNDHQRIVDRADEYDDGSFDQLFEKYRQETKENDGAFTLVEKEIVMALMWMHNNGAKRESFKSRSISPSGTRSCYAQFTHPLGILPVIPKKKSTESGDQRFIMPEKRPSSSDNSHDDHHHILEEEEEEEKAKSSASSKKENVTGILTGYVNKNTYSKTGTAREDKKEGKKKEKKISSSNRKRCFELEDVHKEEEKRSPSKRGKSAGSKALDLGFDFSDEIKAIIGEDGDKDFKLRIRKILYQTDMSAHHDRFTMPCRQINECENLLIGDEKTNVCESGIGVTLVELGLGDNKNSMFTSQLRLKQWDMNTSSSYALRSGWKDVVGRNVGVLQKNDYVQIYSFRRKEELWLVLIKESDHEEGRRDGVFGRSGTQGNDGNRPAIA
ncbi:unnamed protein product [Dovyalis caffra]|uniref:B3 domain-containing protein n=1 Tax=Dovyalis caffra TaxID=77055 RepID=A0AAV1S076_9ROSI|nr:unnamed protein product [Dovyalis caffra]